METIDNQDNSKQPELETPSENQGAISSQNDGASNALDFSKLTHQNWLYINAFLSTSNISKAYQLAKYSGKDESAPYQIFKKLKPYIEQIGDLDVTSRARLQADLKSVLDLPLAQSKKELNLKEWLDVRKFAAKITPEATNSKPNISVLVINRPARKDDYVDLKGDKGHLATSNTTDSPEIIDVEAIPNP